MYLYCERILFDKINKTYEAILDFKSIKDLEYVATEFQIETNVSSKTILILTGLKFENYIGFRSGNWYNIPRGFFNEFKLVNRHDENKHVIAEIKYDSGTLLNVMKYRSKTFFHYDTYNFLTEYNETCLYRDLVKLKSPLNDLGFRPL